MEISYYFLVLLQLLLTMNYGLGARNGGGVDTDWQLIVSTHLCPLIACEGWCDCSEVESNFTFANTTVDVSPECSNRSYSAAGKLKSYMDCDPVVDQAYFRWWPTGQGALAVGQDCLPYAMAGARLERVRGGDIGLYWKVCLEAYHCLNVTELCTPAPPEDSCSICNRGTNSTTSAPTLRQPGNGIRTPSSSGAPLTRGLSLPSGCSIPSGLPRGNTGNLSTGTGLIPEVASIIAVGILLAFVTLYGIIITLMYLHLRRSNIALKQSVSDRLGDELDLYTSLDATTMEQPAYEDTIATRDGNRGHTNAIEGVEYENQKIVKQTDIMKKSFLGVADENTESSCRIKSDYMK